jgi:hypothetical protein
MKTAASLFRMPRGLGCALALALALALPATARADTLVANWTFSEASQTTLNRAANTGAGWGGAGTTWDVAMAGVATNGSGLLNVRNTGAGGSGTRTAYADFGPSAAPNTGRITAGTVSLYATFASWNLAGAGANGPRLTLALVEGNDFTTAQFSLAATAAGVTLSGSVDAFGNGAPLVASALFGVARSAPLTVRVVADLGLLRYSVDYDTGAGWVTLGSAAVDSFTGGINSVRLSLNGDFTVGAQADRGLAVDRIWVVEGAVGAIPEPAAAWLLLVGLGAVASVRRRVVRAGR